MQAYGINEEKALQFKGTPIYGLENLVESKVPLLHVVGQADRVLPVEENTDIIEEKILGGGRNYGDSQGGCGSSSTQPEGSQADCFIYYQCLGFLLFTIDSSLFA